MKQQSPEEIVNFRNISDRYNIYLVDLWGVIHNGLKLFDNAIYVLKKLKCGLIVKPNYKNFVKTIKLLYSNRRKLRKFSKNAKINIIKNFNIQNYKRLLENELFK